MGLYSAEGFLCTQTHLRQAHFSCSDTGKDWEGDELSGAHNQQLQDGWEHMKRSFPETSSSSFVMVLSRGGGGCSVPLWGLAAAAKISLRLSVKKQDDVPARAGDNGNHSAAGAEISCKLPSSETPRCPAGGDLTGE